MKEYMKEYKAIALGPFVTAREMNNGYIMLFVPSDQADDGHILPSKEIYLSRDLITKLAVAFPPKEDASDE